MKTLNNAILAAIFAACTLWCNYSAAQNKAVSFTQDDRNMLIRVDERINSLEDKINLLEDKIDYKFDALQIQINDIKSFMFWGFGILFGVTITSTIGLVGFILWDRRSIERKVIESEENNQKIFHIFKQQAKEDKKLAEILKLTGII